MLTKEQTTEMNVKLREAGRSGDPGLAQRYREALLDGRYYEPPTPEPEIYIEQPPFKGPGSGKDTWQEFAKAQTDMEPEVIDALGKGDLITMLRAQGVIGQPQPEPDNPKPGSVEVGNDETIV
jgi:hypothetical protein